MRESRSPTESFVLKLKFNQYSIMAVYIPTNSIITKFTSRGKAYSSCKKNIKNYFHYGQRNSIKCSKGAMHNRGFFLETHFMLFFMECTSFLMSVFITGYALFEIEFHIKVTKHM